MKTKYDMLNKEERKELVNKFKKKNYNLYIKTRNMFVLCYIGIIYSCIVFIYDYYYKKGLSNFIADATILLFCIFCLLKVNKIKKNILNDFIIKK